jgi:hypothetical protein
VLIDEMAIQRLNIEAPLKAGEEPGAAEIFPDISTEEAPGGQKKWAIEVRKAVISEANWNWSDDPAGGIAGIGLTLVPDGPNAWVIDAEGGTLRQAGWPELDIETASMRWQNPTLYINSSSLRNGESRMSVSGSVEARQSVNLDVNFDGMDVQPLLAPDWRARLSGRLSGHANVQAPLGAGDAGRAVTVSGSATLVDGVLTALPILDQIGTFTQTERFRRLELTTASADFTSTPDRLEVRNLVVESEGLIRVEGDYTVVDGQIDGTFQLGLTPSTLQWIPGSQEDIFTAYREGYRWTTVKLTGPATHPEDDLTPRLVAATGKSAIQGAAGAAGAVQKAADGVLDLLLH